MRREAGVGSSRHNSASGGVDAVSLSPTSNNPPASENPPLWPKDCVPVPLETLKRMMADLAAAHSEKSAAGVGAVVTKSNDDTSNDAADLSQEEKIAVGGISEIEEEEDLVTTVEPKAKPAVPKKRSAKTKKSPRDLDVVIATYASNNVKNKTQKDVHVVVEPEIVIEKAPNTKTITPPPPPPSTSGTQLQENAALKRDISTSSSKEPDEKFLVASDDDDGDVDKLYSSATDSYLVGAEKPSPDVQKKPPPESVPAKTSNSSSEDLPKKKTGDFYSKYALRTSQEDAAKETQRPGPAQPLALMDSSESESNQKRLPVNPENDGSTSGPEAEIDDDDFWN